MTTPTRIPVNDLRGGWAANDPEVGRAVQRVIESGWYIQGPEHRAFEAELAAYLDVAHVAGVANGTDALVLALLAVGCKAGDEVVTCANAGAYTSTAIAQVGGRAAYGDVDPESLVVTPETVGRAIGPSTRIVVVTHLYGNVVDVEGIVALCRPRGIAVIEDCAQSIGGRDAQGRMSGSLADVAAFSFYPTKNLGAVGDGGAVACNDEATDARVRHLRQYGWTAKYRIEVPGGRNSRLDELQAAVLRIGLAGLDARNSRRREIVARYRDACSGSPIRVVTGAGRPTVAHLAVVRTRGRDALRAALHEEGIDTDIHYPYPDHLQPGLPPPSRSTDLGETEVAAAEILTLPCYPGDDGSGCRSGRRGASIVRGRGTLTDGIRYSVIVPVYRNRDSIPDLVARLQELAGRQDGPMEVVFVVDGSPDDSVEIIRETVRLVPLTAQLITLSRNFGSFSAIRAGLANARGEYIAVMAADLQEPPEIAETFFASLRAGECDIAVGERIGRADPSLSSRLYWSAYRRFVNREIPPGGVDVFGCTAEVAARIAAFPEASTSLIGLLFWIGYRRKAFPYARQPRQHGKSGWTLARKVRYLLDSIYAFTDLPILVLQAVGLIGILGSFVFGVVVFVAWLIGSVREPGYTPLMIVLLASTSAILFALGVVGSYAARAFENTKGRPVSIIAAHELLGPRE